MADFLDKKAKAQCDPRKAEKQLAMTKVFRTLVQKAAEARGNSTTNETPPRFLPEPPATFAPPEMWEEYLETLSSLPAFSGKMDELAHCRRMNEVNKELYETLRKTTRDGE